MTSVHVVRLHLLRAEKRQPLIASICSRGKFDLYARGTAPSLFKWKRETYTLQRIFRNSSGSSRNFIGRIAGWLVPVWDVIVIELQQQLSPSLSLSLSLSPPPLSPSSLPLPPSLCPILGSTQRSDVLIGHHVIITDISDGTSTLHIQGVHVNRLPFNQY